VNPILQAARDKRAKHQEKLDALLEEPTQEARAFKDEEAAEFETLVEKIMKLDRQIDGLEAEEKRREKAEAAAATPPSSPAVVKSEPMTYDLDGRNSYFRDLASISAGHLDPSLDAAGARERLARHAKEVEIEARTNNDLARRLREIRSTPNGLRQAGEFEQRVNPNTTAGTGGEFVPPLWLVSQYAPFKRPGRVFANRVTNMPLPPGIDVINVPKITTGSSTAIQTANAAAVSSTDIVTTSVSASVNTIAGQEDISLQLLEQSPIAMDGVVFDDLSRDYDQRLDIQVVSGTAANGQHRGVLTVTGATSNTDPTKASEISSTATALVDATAANSSQYKHIANAVNQIETLRYASPTAIWVHPRRANYWATFPSSSDGRPIFIPSKYGPFNVVGLNESSPVTEGVAGELYGLPVIKDANMLTTANGFSGGALQTGGTQDPVVVLKEDDLWLWEGTMRMRALPEILSGTLQIRFQLYCYSAFLPNRFAASISQIAGAGYAAPSF